MCLRKRIKLSGLQTQRELAVVAGSSPQTLPLLLRKAGTAWSMRKSLTARGWGKEAVTAAEKTQSPSHPYILYETKPFTSLKRTAKPFICRVWEKENKKQNPCKRGRSSSWVLIIRYSATTWEWVGSVGKPDFQDPG